MLRILLWWILVPWAIPFWIFQMYATGRWKSYESNGGLVLILMFAAVAMVCSVIGVAKLVRRGLRTDEPHVPARSTFRSAQKPIPAGTALAQAIERFIERVESNDHTGAIADFYTENARMRENQSIARNGRANLIAHEQKVLDRAEKVTSRCIRPIFMNGTLVVLRWHFRFEWRDGTVTEIEELAYQRWEGSRIADEQFFYDPAQLKPRIGGSSPTTD